MYILYFLPYFFQSTCLQMVFNINVYFLSTFLLPSIIKTLTVKSIYSLCDLRCVRYSTNT